jgi:hypothetical protein
MSDPKPTDAILELLKHQGETLLDLRKSQVKQTEDLHAIRVDQAAMAARLEAMTSIPARVATLERQFAAHGEALRQHADLHASHKRVLEDLKSEADRRSGWSGPVGKVVMAVITALAVMLVSAIIAVIDIHGVKAAPPPPCTRNTCQPDQRP